LHEGDITTKLHEGDITKKAALQQNRTKAIL
jgi:hypothetical protein